MSPFYPPSIQVQVRAIAIVSQQPRCEKFILILSAQLRLPLINVAAVMVIVMVFSSSSAVKGGG
eukprot:scaffold41092_cov277-Skeletonema_marinoi.AAC.1